MELEKLIISSLVHNEEFAKKTIAYIKEEYFESDATRFLFRKIYDFINKYGSRPTKDALTIIVQESTLSENNFNEAFHIVNDMKEGEEDTKWIIDTAEQWAKDRAIFNALHEAISIVQGNGKEDVDKNIIPTILTEALSVCFDSYLGHDYFEHAEKQFEYMHEEQNRFPFSIPVLNRVTKGGIPPKTLNVILMAINLGKSVFLIDQAAHWLLNGKNVVFFTLEMAEEVVRERIDTRILDLTFDDVHTLSKDQYLSRIRDIRERTMGNLIIKEYPTGSAHVGHFRHTLEELRMKNKFRPDLIAVDYMTIMRSSKLGTNAMGNTNTYFTSVAEELRALGSEYNVPVWTAAQFNRTGQKGSHNVGMDDVGQAIGIAATADFMLAGRQPPELIERSEIMFRVLKNRYNNKNKLSEFVLGVEYEKQKFFDVDASVNLHVNRDKDVRAELMGKSMVNKQNVDPDTGEVFNTWKF